MNYLAAVDHSFVHAPSGAPRVAWDMARAMRERGHTVGLICAHPPGAPQEPSAEELDGVCIVQYRRPGVASWDPRYVLHTMRNLREALGRHLSRQRWDVVHTHTVMTGVGAMSALGTAPRYVGTVHSPVVPELDIVWGAQGRTGRVKRLLGMPLIRYLEDRRLRGSAAVHVLSRFTQRELSRFHGPAVIDRVRVVPHWRRRGLRRSMPRQEARRRLGWPADRRVLLTVRNQGPRYGIDTAIEAIGPLAAGGSCRFYIGGDGPCRADFERRVVELGCGAGVRFLGRISDEELGLAYQAADLFVLPTRALECFGLIILEALSCGCPVLSTDAGAIPEVMRPILPDFIVPAGDAAALRRKVERFLDGTLCPPPEEELVRYVDERYDRAVLLPRMVALLEG